MTTAMTAASRSGGTLISPTAAEPAVTGLCDCGRASRGDPAAGWAVFRTAERPGTERGALRESLLIGSVLDGYASIRYMVLQV